MIKAAKILTKNLVIIAATVCALQAGNALAEDASTLDATQADAAPIYTSFDTDPVTSADAAAQPEATPVTDDSTPATLAKADDTNNSQDMDQEFADVTPVGASELDADRGAGTQVYNLSGMSASLAGNTNNNTVSGDNFINNGALSGVSGFANVIQNSGSNVIVQQSTIVSVTFQ